MLSVTFLAAPAEDVAATATIEVPIARRMSRWKTRVSTGTIDETAAEAEQRSERAGQDRDPEKHEGQLEDSHEAS